MKKTMMLFTVLMATVTSASGENDGRVAYIESITDSDTFAEISEASGEDEGEGVCERLLTDDKWWIYEHKVYIGVFKGNYLIKRYISGDTIVNGQPAKILRDVVVDDDYQEIVSSPLAGFPKRRIRREEGEKLCFPIGDGYEPLMDFTLEPGDKVYTVCSFTPTGHYLEVVSVREMMLHGIMERVLLLVTSGDYPFYCLWISGVGSPNFDHIYYEATSNQKSTHIIKCFKGTECIYSEDDYDMLVQSGIDEPHVTSHIGNDRYYSLQGIRIAEPRKGEVCIVRGADGSARKVLF